MRKQILRPTSRRHILELSRKSVRLLVSITSATRLFSIKAIRCGSSSSISQPERSRRVGETTKTSLPITIGYRDTKELEPKLARVAVKRAEPPRGRVFTHRRGDMRVSCGPGPDRPHPV